MALRFVCRWGTNHHMTFAEAMQKKGLTDQTLAAKVGVTRPTITKIRRSQRRPSLELALKIERETDLPVSHWAGDAAA